MPHEGTEKAMYNNLSLKERQSVYIYIKWSEISVELPSLRDKQRKRWKYFRQAAQVQSQKKIVDRNTYYLTVFKRSH